MNDLYYNFFILLKVLFAFSEFVDHTSWAIYVFGMKKLFQTLEFFLYLDQLKLSFLFATLPSHQDSLIEQFVYQSQLQPSLSTEVLKYVRQEIFGPFVLVFRLFICDDWLKYKSFAEAFVMSEVHHN